MSKKHLMDRMPKHKILLNPTSYRMAHPIYEKEDLESIKVTHQERNGFKDHLSYGAVWAARRGFDLFTGYNPAKMDERKWLNRIIFLETVAGVPGMVGGMQRHLRSLRTLDRDHGWIHHLLEEAENERMHLFFFLKQRNPGIMFRLMITGAQFAFFHAYFFAYLVSPALCHRFVGYLEEEAVYTYTVMIKSMDEGNLPLFEQMKAPIEAIEYYNLDPDASYRDLLLSIRADEACHRELNHHFSDVPSWA
jgi:hypothetical protein